MTGSRWYHVLRCSRLGLGLGTHHPGRPGEARGPVAEGDPDDSAQGLMAVVDECRPWCLYFDVVPSELRGAEGCSRAQM